MTSTQATTWLDLPAAARDWLRPGERATFWLPPVLADSDRLAAWDQLAEWDALVGRMLRAALFDDSQDARRVREDAEAVASVADALAVRLSLEFGS